MRRDNTRRMVLYAMFIALTFIAAYTPYVGFVSTGIVTFTTIHIFVLIASFTLGYKGGVVTGLTFGLTSWYVALTRASQPFDLLFVNPLISVLPRLLFGLASGAVGEFFLIWMRKQSKTISKSPLFVISLVGASAILTALHTFLVINACYIFENGKVYGEWGLDYLTFFASFLILLVLFEILAAGIVVPSVVLALIPFVKRKEKYYEEE